MKALLCIHHFTPNYFDRYTIPLKHVKALREVLNTDDVRYGGSGKVRGDVRLVHEGGHFVGAEVSLPPLATVIYEVEWE